jgi:hypothetical protein
VRRRAGVLVVAGVVVDLEVGVELADLLDLHEVRLVQVEVAEVDLAGLDALAEAELVHVLAVGHLAAGLR